VLTQIQVGYWKDTATLFGHALRSTEKNFMALYIIAQGMVKAGDLKGAEEYYRETIRLRPSIKHAYNGLGHLLMIQGRQEEASAVLEKGLRIDPAFAPALKHLGDVRARQGRIADSIPLYRAAVAIGHDDPELLNNYGVALYVQGDRKEAVMKISEALRLKPDYSEAQGNLRKILASEDIPTEKRKRQADGGVK